MRHFFDNEDATNPVGTASSGSTEPANPTTKEEEEKSLSSSDCCWGCG